MRVIRFFRWNEDTKNYGATRNGFLRGEIALNETELWRKLDGQMALVQMPAKPWWIRLYRLHMEAEAREEE